MFNNYTDIHQSRHICLAFIFTLHIFITLIVIIYCQKLDSLLYNNDEDISDNLSVIESSGNFQTYFSNLKKIIQNIKSIFVFPEILLV